MKRQFIQFARIYSAIFSPFFATMMAFIWLFVFTRFSLMTTSYKLHMLFVVLMFTICIPRSSIFVFRRVNKWSHWQLSHREHRHMPYVLTLLSYVACVLLLYQTRSWAFFRGIILSAIVAQVVCFIINIWWKVSTHMVGMGGLVGMVVSFSIVFFFNPTYLLCILIFLSGLLGTCRMLLRQHSLSQVLVGFAIGFTCAMLSLVFRWSVHI